MNAQNVNWDDFRIARAVAHHGTLSGAAAVLGLHHATVLRRVAALEKRIGARLFQRHSRGYTPTDAGRMLLQVVNATAEQFDALSARLADPAAGISGRLILTTLPEIVEGLLPFVATFQALYPDTQIDVLAEARTLRLEYGEAHLSIRAGPEPREPDNIVRALGPFGVSFYASPDYIAAYGTPDDREDTEGHRYISRVDVNRRNLPVAWIEDNVPDEQIVFRAGDAPTMRNAGLAGLGIVPLPDWYDCGDLPSGLTRLFPPPEEWRGQLWLVTHRDNHRSPKVQAMHRHLLAEFGAAIQGIAS